MLGTTGWASSDLAYLLRGSALEGDRLPHVELAHVADRRLPPELLRLLHFLAFLEDLVVTGPDDGDATTSGLNELHEMFLLVGVTALQQERQLCRRAVDGNRFPQVKLSIVTGFRVTPQSFGALLKLFCGEGAEIACTDYCHTAARRLDDLHVPVSGRGWRSGIVCEGCANDERGWVLERPVVQDAEMQVVPGRCSGSAHAADELTSGHRRAVGDIDVVLMSVVADVPICVSDLREIAVIATGPSEDHGAGSNRMDPCILGCTEIQPLMIGTADSAW